MMYLFQLYTKKREEKYEKKRKTQQLRMNLKERETRRNLRVQVV